MRTVQSEEKSGKATALLEWQTCDSDAEWQSPQQVTRAIPVLSPEIKPRSGWVVRHWYLGVALFIILAASASWTWRVARQGEAQIEADLQDRVELDLWTTAQDDGLRPTSKQEIQPGSTFTQNATAHPLTSTVKLLALPGETAIVQLVTQSGADQPTFRQTRFYWKTTEGWLHIKPDANVWGSPRRLESDHFIFQYRQNDAKVVAAVAPQIDNVYAVLQRNFGLTPNAEKLVIEVTVEQVTEATPIVRWPLEPLVVSSPAVYVAPVEVNDSTILAQSIALSLIEYMGERAIKDHAIPTRWQPLLQAMRLWQLWDLDMPLARWRHDVVTFLYADTSIDDRGRHSMAYGAYTELCAMHSLWMLSPVMVGIPLECRISDEGSWVAMPRLEHGPPTHLDQLGIPLKRDRQFLDGDNFFFSPSEATLLEYIVATYGYKQLPVLLAGLAQYDKWETLVPAVFGVSAPNFETGWRSYLARQYNVHLKHGD